ncbi:MAG: 5-oxoprolinase subunit PxpB [Pseudomonadota bacterium]
MTPRILPYGDCAFLIEYGNEIERTISERILIANEELLRADLNGLTETFPTFRSLLIKYDPLKTSFSTLSQEVIAIIKSDGQHESAPRRWKIPVCYEEEFAPDLADVADAKGVSPTKVIDLHIREVYHIYMLGFIAGYPYMGDLNSQLSLPRRTSPRVRVPAGSIAIALTMAAIYPVVSPGGWHLIGRTPISIFDPNREKPALFAPGDEVIFRPVDKKRHDALQAAIDNDGYQIEPEVI